MEVDPLTGRSPETRSYPISSAKPFTEQEQASEDIRQLLFVHGKPYGQQYEEWGEKHPFQKMGVEVASQYIPYGRLLARAPGVIGAIGTAIDLSQKQYQPGSEGWTAGAQIAPKYRHPAKRRLNEELDTIRDKFDYNDWTNHPEGLIREGERAYNRAYNGAIDNMTNTGRLDFDTPQQLTVYRSETRSGNVPGRAIYTTVDPRSASRFNTDRGPERGKGYASWTEERDAMRRVHAMDIEYKKPLIYGVHAPTPKHLFQSLDEQMQFTREEGLGLARRMDAAINTGRKFGNRPLEDLSPKELAEMERPMVHMERFIARVARKRGYDVILKGGAQSIPEAIVLDKKIIKPKFAGEEYGMGTSPERRVAKETDKPGPFVRKPSNKEVQLQALVDAQNTKYDQAKAAAEAQTKAALDKLPKLNRAERRRAEKASSKKKDPFEQVPLEPGQGGMTEAQFRKFLTHGKEPIPQAVKDAAKELLKKGRYPLEPYDPTDVYFPGKK